jgi:hypothetical protein
MASDKRELLFLLKFRDTGAKKGLNDLGDAAEDTRDDVDDMRAGLRHLDDQIGESSKRVAGLRKEISKSGDLGLVKDLEKADRDLRKLNRQRKLLIGGDDGEESAEDFAAGFVGRLGPLVARAPISAPLVGAFAAAAPLVSSVIGGAVTAGVGAAAIGGGIAIAMKNPVVKAAGKQLGAEFGELLAESAQPFVPATLEGIELIRGRLRGLKPEFDRIFADSAKNVVPLANAGVTALDRFADGFAGAVENADPLIDVLVYHIPRAADVAGEALETLSQNAEFNADTLSAALTTVEFSIKHAANATNLLSELFKYSFGGAVTDATDGLRGAETGIRRIGDTQSEVTGQFATATDVLRSYREALDDATGTALDVEQANLRWQQSIDETRASLEENGKTLDANTEKGRGNRQSLVDLAEAGRRRVQSIYDQTIATQGSAEAEKAAQDAYAETRRQLVAAAAKYLGSAEAAEKYVTEVLGIPPSKTTKVTIETTTAERNLRTVKELIAAIKSKRVVITAVTRSEGRNVPIGDGIGGRAHGGPIYGPGPKGVDSVLIKAAPGEHMLTAREVDAAGGHQAIEQWRRSLVAPNQTGASAAAASPSVSAARRGGQTSGGAPFGWAGMERSFVQFLVSAISGAGGDPSVLRIGRGRAA